MPLELRLAAGGKGFDPVPPVADARHVGNRHRLEFKLVLERPVKGRQQKPLRATICLGRTLRSGRQHSFQPRADQRLGLRHDPIDQFLAGRDVIN